jgi:ABC-type sugar transport system substrate-binding protein
MTMTRITRLPAGMLALGCVLSLAVAACSSGGSSSGSDTTASASAAEATVSLKGAVVQVIDSVPSPAVAGLDEGYRKAAKQLGISLEFAQSNGDPTTDIANIQDAISKGAKGLLLIPVSVAGDTPALRQAVAANMCVGVGYSDITPSDPITPGIKTYFGYNDQFAGRNLTAAIAKEMGGKGGLVYIGGTATDPGSQTREKAISAELQQNYPGIKFLGAQPGNYSSATAYTIMQNFIQRYGSQITGVIAAADNMAQAAANYIATTYLKGKIAIGGFGGQATFVSDIKAGKAYATAPYPVVSDGERAMQRIAQCIEGNRTTVYDSSTTEPVLQPLKSAGYILTAGNLNGYTPQY